MIIQTEVDGRNAFVAFFDENMEPVDKGKEAFIKVMFEDDNEVRWMIPSSHEDEDEDEELDADDSRPHHPRI
jgi:hypothetical protein